MYYRIQKYKKIIPNFALYFTWSKLHAEFNYLYPIFWDDLFQTIALCAIEYKTDRAISNALGRELYYLARHVYNMPLLKSNQKNTNRNIAPFCKCDECGREKNQYLRKSLIPGKRICGKCYQKTKRDNKRRNKIMHTVDLIANAIKNEPNIEIPENTEPGICCVTSIECQTIRKKDILSSNFCNSDILLAPDSNRIGISAAIALQYKWERYSSWFVDEKQFIRFDKKLFRDMFLNGVQNSKAWSIYITTSYKKHGALFTKVNNYKYGIWRFEMLDVDARDGSKNRRWYEKISDALINKKIGRSVIESLDCPAWLINKIGLKNWMEFYNWAKDKWQSPLYKLCCYLLPSQEDLKNESVS